MNKKDNYKLKAIIITLFFIVFSVYIVYDASSIWSKYKFNDEFYYLKRQSIYAFISILFLFLGQKIKIEKIKKYFIYCLLISYILLVLVLIPHIGITRGGSSSWLGFSFLSFQPSEIFKICLICYTGHYLSDNFSKTNKLKTIIPIILFLLIGAILIMLQPDFGTLVVIGSALIVQLFLSKMKIRYFLLGGGLITLLLILMIVIEPYRMKRITSFIDPFADPLGSGFQIIQSMFALGPGGLIGEGINSSIQKYFYLPEPQTDFIFSIIVEEFGFLGGLFIIILYFLLFYYLYKVIIYQNNRFKYLLSMGLLSLIVIQVIINLGVVVSLFPVTGITLPFLSYGGSSLVMLSFSVGLILGEEK